jgi:hypothetical protein
MREWRPTRIERVVRVYATSTGAARVVTDAGAAVVKLPGNPSGPHALVCELVGTRLAAWMGLPTFDLALMHYTGWPEVVFKGGDRAQAGTAIAMRYVAGTAWGADEEGLARVENPEAMAGLVVLDTLTLNKDRYYPHRDPVRENLGNVFLCREGATSGRLRLLAMDHTECLRENGGDLKARLHRIDRVRDTTVHGLFPAFVPHVTEANAAPFLQRLSELTPEVAGTFAQEIPGDWEASDAVRRALQGLLVDRARFLSTHLWPILARSCGWSAPPDRPGG